MRVLPLDSAVHEQTRPAYRGRFPGGVEPRGPAQPRQPRPGAARPVDPAVDAPPYYLNTYTNVKINI